MTRIKRYQDIEAWKLGRVVAKEVYRLTGREQFRREWTLRDQMRRAAVSVVSNIAEGFNRNGNTELKQFLAHAKGSAAELQAQCYVALDTGYMTAAEFETLHRQTEEVQNLLGGFLRYLARTPNRGSKFHP